MFALVELGMHVECFVGGSSFDRVDHRYIHAIYRFVTHRYFDDISPNFDDIFFSATAYHHIFPIGNLTPNPNSIFHRPIFSLGVTFRIFFLSYFIFSFKNKIKVSRDSKSFFQKIKS